MLVREDFIRCNCGCADFEEKVIVTVPKVQKKRDEMQKHIPITNMGEHYIYYCVACGKKLDK